MTAKTEKIKGMFLGIAIGDALGMPVECFTAEKIAENCGRITDYLSPDGHKWFDGQLPGSTTDDTQLSLVVAESLIAKKGFDLQDIAERHVAAMKETTHGWGGTTKEGVRRFANGASYKESGVEGGAGNGCAMKVAPLAVYQALQERKRGPSYNYDDDLPYTDLIEFTFFTHKLSLAALTTCAHAAAIKYCFNETPESFDDYQFAINILDAFALARGVESFDSKDDRSDNNLLISLFQLFRHKDYDDARIIERFEGGDPYCAHSIPFSLMFFVKNPESIESLYNVINAGGDTDTNGSMVGAMLGALHGPDIFPEELVAGLVDLEKVEKTAEQFAELFDE